jgi:hypothetical protein
MNNETMNNETTALFIVPLFIVHCHEYDYHPTRKHRL